MTEEIISRSIATKVWDRTGIELVTPGPGVRHVSVARHVTDCATRSVFFFKCEMNRNYKDNVPLEVENGIKESCLFKNALYRHFTNGSTLPKKRIIKDVDKKHFKRPLLKKSQK